MASYIEKAIMPAELSGTPILLSSKKLDEILSKNMKRMGRIYSTKVRQPIALKSEKRKVDF